MSRIAFLVSGGGLAFRAVVGACQAGVINPEGVYLICDRPSTALAFAHTNSIECKLVEYNSFENRDNFEGEIIRNFESWRCEWAVLNFNRLLSSRIIHHLDSRCVNLHLSLLPLFPGFGAVQAALRSGMKLAGVTFHYVSEAVDGGPIIAQGAAPILPSDDVAKLTLRLYRTAVPMQIQLCRWIEQGLSPKAMSAEDYKILGDTALAHHLVDPDIALFGAEFFDKLGL